MRIKILGYNKIQILDRDGNDITDKLNITDLSVNLSSNEFPTAQITCEVIELDAELLEEKVSAVVNVLKLAGIGTDDEPEEVLDNTKFDGGNF